ncbi:hypothetical protein ACFOY4_18205 [Actinomadura syzygii]|uniref:ATP-binding protein n=1 Tax=Actinomadura syzygii TaxID=1427538 RepID=A0A5D0TZC0_9ACTN|nr:hypothetical protein [Actinomadura syzygii]TYC11114.1 hypothetical protein FXF65_29605 [Actinomadura syzygii]
MAGGHRIDRTAWPEDGPYRRLLELLDGVHRDNGGKSLREIAAAMNLASASRVNDFLRGRRRPVDDQQLALLVKALGGGEDDVRAAVRLYGQVPVAKTVARSPWAEHVSEHIAWELVDEQRDASAFRDATIDIAERLGRLSGTAEAALDDDLWLDAELAVRFAKRTDWLLRTPLAEFLRDLSPAEAALLVLVPLLHHTHMVKTLAGLRDIAPLDLGAEGGEGARREYETFLRGQRELVDRAQARTLPDRDPATTEIGWWLFHRWVARYPQAYALGAVHALLSGIEIADHRMRDEVLDAKTVQRFLAALRLDLSELGDTDRKNAPQFETVLFAGEPHEQRVRELLIGQILTVAYALTLDLVRLPDIVVRHLGIPHPVDLGELRETVSSRAKWVLQSDCLVLRADCHHAAELEGLRQYASQVDALLHTIRQGCGDHSTMQVLTRLPSRASADDVRPGTNDDGRLLFQRVSRFRLDERRVQDLLMGEQLYQDRGLAIRELYQNALDACRYRRARHAYRSRGDWLDEWNGRIHFTQGVDENGRAYLECRDNGIGMTESVLTEVFSQAGARFTDTTEFLIESADWKNADPPIPFHANSRFGIGVLSYFMIADEIEVVTRPLDRGHRSNPTLMVSIFGPGHLFHIEHLPTDRSPGTSVKLYLRESEDALSCVEELRRFLGIAEFRTTAEHEAQRETWESGVLRPRARPSWETDGLDAHGKLVPWKDDDGGQVVWCEKGGGLLVDGIYVKPSVRRGVFAGLEDGTLYGAVVNLTGAHAPEQISVDRRKVLSDVSDQSEKLLVSALSELISTGRDLLDVCWLSNVAWASPRLGDLISEASAESSAGLMTREGTVDVAHTGCLLQDSYLALEGDRVEQRSEGEGLNFWNVDFGPYVSDHVAIWRMAAHGRLPDFMKESVVGRGRLRRARPSDTFLLGGISRYVQPDRRVSPNDWAWERKSVERFPGHVLWVALLTGVTPREVAQRAVDVGVEEIQPERFPASGGNEVDLTLLSERRTGRPQWWEVTDVVPYGHIAAVALQFGCGLRDLMSRLERYGHLIPPGRPPEKAISAQELRMLCWSSDDVNPINSRPQPLPSSHVVKSAWDLGISTSEVCEWIREFGFHVDDLALPARPSEADYALFDWRFGYEEQDEIDPTLTLSPAHLVRASLALNISIPEVAARLAAYGVPVPSPRRLPERASNGDLKLLSRDGDGFPPWWPIEQEIPLSNFLIVSSRADLEPEQAAARLAEYGMRVPNGPFPAKLDEPRMRLLSKRFFTGAWLDPRCVVHRAHLVRASVEMGISPGEAAGHLIECGLTVPPGEIANAPDPVDLVLLRYGHSISDRWLDVEQPVPLLHLLRVSRRLGMSVWAAAERLRWLGMDVSDVDDSIAEALRRVPWA